MGMGDRQEGGGYTHQLSRQGQATRAQTRKSGSGLSQRTRRRVTQAPMTALWSLQGAPWQPWQPVPWGGCKLKTPSAGRSPCGTGSLPQQSPPQPDDGRSLHQWRSIQGQYWLELQKVQHNIQSALNKRRDSGRSSGSHSDSDVGTDARAPSQHRSGPVHPEQELWGRNCALLLGSCAQGRTEEKAPGAAEHCEACQTGLQRHHGGIDFLNRRCCSLPKGSALGSTKDHHPAPPHTSRSTPPSTLTSPSPIPTTAPLNAQSFTNAAPFFGLFSTIFGS